MPALDRLERFVGTNEISCGSIRASQLFTLSGYSEGLIPRVSIFVYKNPLCKKYSGYFWDSLTNKKKTKTSVWRQIISIHNNVHEASCNMVTHFKVFFCHELWPFLENIFQILLNLLSIFATAVDRCDIMWIPLNYSLWVCRGARIRISRVSFFAHGNIRILYAKTILAIFGIL